MCKKNNLDISVIIVSYNTLEMTIACLDSLYKTLGKLKAQVIVVDNDSLDGSADAISNEFPDVELIRNNSNVGFAAANNQAFKLAKSDLVLLLNSDTIVLGNTLQDSVTYMNTHDNVGAMGCRVLNTDLSTQKTCSGYPTLGRLAMTTFGLDRISSLFDNYLMRSWGRDYEKDVDVISGCYLLTRSNVIQQVGYLDERFFFFGEETDWCLRIKEKGWAIKFAPVGEIIHHGGGSVKKLNFQRDVMLTDAMIKLHRKNGGLLHARIAYLILLIFNISRATYWTFIALIKSSAYSKAKHFRNVVNASINKFPKE